VKYEDDVGIGRRMQVEMQPSNFNAGSHWFRVSSIRLQRHTKSLDNFAEPTFVTVMQEVPVSWAFEAYPAKPPQAHENNHRGPLAMVAGGYLPLYNEFEKFTIS
jgi:hypothetical protein